jgi:hypothetical protein
MAYAQHITRALLLVALALVIVALRYHSIDEPLERDLTTYAYIAHYVSQGETLYDDLWDHKPPGIFWAFGAAEKIWGYSPLAVNALGSVVSIVALIFLYFLLRRLADETVALLGAVCWVLASNSVALQANQPNVELFLNALSIIGLWALTWTMGAADRPACLLFAGSCFALASAFKTVVAFPVAAIAVYMLLELRGVSPARRLRRVVYLAAPAAALWMGIFGYFYLQGRFQPFWEAVFVFNAYYSDSPLLNVVDFLASPSKLFNECLSEIWILVALSTAWFLGPRRESTILSRRFFVYLTVGLMAAVAAPGKGYAHYYQLLLPVLCTLSALMLSPPQPLPTDPAVPRGSLTAAAGVLATLVFLTYFQVRYLSWSPEQISAVKYNSEFVDARRVGIAVAGLTGPKDRIYVFGSETGIYYYSKRPSASGIIYLASLIDGPERFRRQKHQRLYSDVVTRRPAVFVHNHTCCRLSDSPFSEFLSVNYTEIRTIGRFSIYVPRQEAGEMQ